MQSFAIGANVCLADCQMIKYTVPNWLYAFDERLKEIVLVVDPRLPSGRLKEAHKELVDLDILLETIEELKKSDSRIRVSMLREKAAMDEILKKWFKKGKPIRCQGGTPIAAFIQAVEEPDAEIVLRCDCDFLFFENGWLDEASELLEKGIYDVIEPPMLGVKSRYDISSGAFIIKPDSFTRKCLPMKAHCIDIARRIHRFIHKRPPWLALEDIFLEEKKAGRLNHCNLEDESGFTLHIPQRTDVLLPGFKNVIGNIQYGNFSEEQRAIGRNFVPSKWPENFWELVSASRS